MIAKLTQVYAFDFTEIKFSKTLIRYLTVNILMFAIPLILGGPQLLVGAVVNFCLVYIAINYKKNELLPAIFLPAIASVLHGVIWGPLTFYLAALLPLIWLGNALLVLGIKALLLHKLNHIFAVILPGLFKVSLLLGGTYLLVSLFKFPTVLLTSMGLIQLFTFLIGSSSYLVLIKVLKKFQSKGHVRQ